MATIDEVIAFELGECGYDRYADPEEGTRYGRWYADVTGEEWAAQNGIAYCVMFQSYCFAMCGQPEPFFPSQNCDDVVNRASEAGMLVPVGDLRTGDLVIFDWGDGGILDHIGLVEWVDGDEVHTIEGNTDNGKVKRRTRTYQYIVRVVRPAYDGAVKPPGWQYEASVDKWWYRNPDGTWPVDTWVEIDGEWYHFDASGWVETGFRRINGAWYYLHERRDGRRGAMDHDLTIRVGPEGQVEV